MGLQVCNCATENCIAALDFGCSEREERMWGFCFRKESGKEEEMIAVCYDRSKNGELNNNYDRKRNMAYREDCHQFFRWMNCIYDAYLLSVFVWKCYLPSLSKACLFYLQ